MDLCNNIINIMYSVIRSLIYSVVYMGIVGMCLMYTVFMLLDLIPDVKLLVSSFLLSYAIYTFNRFTDVDEDLISQAERLFFIKKFRNVMTLTAVLSYLTAFIIFMSLGVWGAVLAVLPLISSIIYGVKWIPSWMFKYRRLKDVTVVKNLVISSMWSIIPVGAAVLYGRLEINIVVFSVFVFIFIKTFINSVFFDIRDIYGDGIKKINTIPVVIGVQPTLNMLSTLNILLSIGVVIAVAVTWLPKLALFIGLVNVYTHLYLTKKINGDKFMFDLIVDGEDILMAVLAFMGSMMLK